MAEKRGSLCNVTTGDLVEELVARGWKVFWTHGADPLCGNLELEGPEQHLSYNSVRAALGKLSREGTK